MRIFQCFVFLFIHITTMAQSDFDIIDKLYDANLLSKREKEWFFKDLKRHEAHLKKLKEKGADVFIDEEARAVPNYPLELLQRTKIYSTAGTLSPMTFSPAIIEIKKGEEQMIIKKLETFASNL